MYMGGAWDAACDRDSFSIHWIFSLLTEQFERHSAEEMAISKPIIVSSDDDDYTSYVAASCEGNCSSLYIFCFVCSILCV